jgi:hypothetical protein
VNDRVTGGNMTRGLRRNMLEFPIKVASSLPSPNQYTPSYKLQDKHHPIATLAVKVKKETLALKKSSSSLSLSSSPSFFFPLV